jgi:hypothetical protein
MSAAERDFGTSRWQLYGEAITFASIRKGDADAAALVIAPSPLAGEGSAMCSTSTAG